MDLVLGFTVTNMYMKVVILNQKEIDLKRNFILKMIKDFFWK